MRVERMFCLAFCFQTTVMVAFCSMVCFAQVANKVSVTDTRSTNEPPSFYDREVRFEFKQRAALNVPGTGNHSGLMTIAPWLDNSGNKHHQLNFNDGGVFYRTGRPDDASWENWRRLVMENENGNVGIGTTTPQERLSVNGNIRAKEVKVETANWPDYVFNEEYKLMPLAELETHIKTHGHLPGIPSAKEVEADGIGLAEMNRKLLEKVEELTLHLIEKEKAEQRFLLETKAMKQEIAEMKAIVKQLMK